MTPTAPAFNQDSPVHTSTLKQHPRLARSTALVAAAMLALCAPAAHAARATPFPTAQTPVARDIGAAAETSITAMVALKHRNTGELKRLIDELHTPGNPHFRQFLSPAQFHQRFDPTPETVAAATRYFQAAGLSVSREGHLLHVSGSPKALRAAFGVELREFEVAAQGSNPAFRYHAPSGEPSIASPAVAESVNAILGLDNRPNFVPNMRQSPLAARRMAPTAATAAAGPRRNAAAPNEPGYWTVNDVATRYNVQPLYDAGFHGEGRTLAIVTLASFTQSDVYQYWSDNGIATDANRIRVVDVMGGPGPVSDFSGSGETTLDVAQSGGLAPAAKIVVYEAPNSTSAFVGAFYKAVDENVADSLSTSWGGFEWFYTLQRVESKRYHAITLRAFDQVFMQAAAQGQSLFAAQGDAGAYEANRSLPQPFFAPVISIGAPADSPYITSAGGTTLPGVQRYIVDGKPFPVRVRSEQAWGWSYMNELCAAIGFDPLLCGTWGVGAGGGVSSYFPLPRYQQRTAGIAVTEAGQALTEIDVVPPIVYVELPAAFAGRNVPDISLNADPNTGYTLNYTSSNDGYSVTPFYGGTSFVSPQLNGMTALLVQKTGGRVGLLNYPLYAMGRQADAWGQASSPFNDIVAGDNWFYTGRAGYDQASGLGTLNLANFADALARRAAKGAAAE